MSRIIKIFAAIAIGIMIALAALTEGLTSFPALLPTALPPRKRMAATAE